MSYVQTCMSVCLLLVLDYIPKLQRESAQGISQGASGAAALSAEIKGWENGT